METFPAGFESAWGSCWTSTTTIGDAASFAELGVDSMMRLELIALVEQHVGSSFPSSTFPGMQRSTSYSVCRRDRAPVTPCSPVVTGFGVVSSIGVGDGGVLAGIRTGRAGSRPVTSFDTSALRNHVGCEIDAAPPPGRGPPRAGLRCRGPRGWPRSPASEALAAADLGPDEVDGLCVGTTMGDLPEIERHLGDLESPDEPRPSRSRLCARRRVRRPHRPRGRGRRADAHRRHLAARRAT